MTRKHIFEGIKSALLGAVAITIVLYVHTETYREEVAAEQERRETAQRWYSDCKCKPEIQGRQLVASICQAPTNLGPWLHECIYAQSTKGQE